MRLYKKILKFIVLLISIGIIAGVSDNTTFAASGSTTKVKQNQTMFDLKSVPQYDKKPSVEVNNNKPYFTDAEKKKTTSFETYSKLDSLGRCGVAYANLSKDLMPTEERGNIGMVKPSGWHTVKYNDLIEGNYLYNRCHLIGYQLAGENANVKNLITGTRYLNVQGMLPFEEEVADYVKKTGNHVLYRITPEFDGTNLVADGVLMEAYSVEDQGKGICFNVYCYNVQPGIKIDYATGDSSRDDNSTISTATKNSKEENKNTDKTVGKKETDTVNVQPTASYVANKNTKKFHIPTCSSVGDMAEHNKWYFDGTRDQLIEQGYVPCKRCYP